MFNKKLGQIGKTITWVVATVIIIMILIVSILVSTSYLGGSKKADFSKQTDILASKSFFAYLLTEEPSGETIYSKIKTDEDLTDFNGNLALKIFKEFYEKDYPVAIWLGIDFEGLGLPRTNKYFGSRPTSLRGGDITQRRIDFVLEEAILNDDKWLGLILMNK